jgi:flagellar hook protein FlgE
VQTAAIATDFSQGSIEVDADPLQLALEGEGFFIVEGPQGEHFYTRVGNFQLNADRELVTGEGYRVLGYSVDEEYRIREGELVALRIPEGVQVESESGVALMTGFNIDRDGRIRARFSDGTVRDFGQLRVARFANPSGLERRGRNLYAMGPNSGLPVEGYPASRGTAAIIAGARERSNTDIGRNLIGLARASLQFRASLAVFRETDRLYGELMNLRRPA